MKPWALISLFFIVLACTVSSLGQLVQVAEPKHLPMLRGRQITRLSPRIALRIYDFDHVESSVIVNAKEVTSEIFREAGLETTWVDCVSQERCSTDARGPEFRIRIIPQAVSNAMVSDESLGFAIPCADVEEACLCYVSYWRVKVLAESNHIAADRLLGHVIAHEIGHALLGSNAHIPFGIMQHNLPIRETERILYFTSGQAKQLQANLLARAKELDR